MGIAIYARMTKLTGVVGRVDYISNPNRQENLLAVSGTVDDPQFWKQLAKDSQTAWRQAGGHKDGSKCCEGREIHVQLPNDGLNRDLQKMADNIAKGFKAEYGVDCKVAIHLNKKKNNLHVHIVFSERQLLPEQVIRKADRNVFLDEQGIRKRTKKEILDENGQVRPGCRIVQKGEILSERYFGEKDPQFKSKEWLHGYKQNMANWINEYMNPDIKREVFNQKSLYLAQMHIGKGRPEKQRQRIEEYNLQVKAFNKMVRERLIDAEKAQQVKTYVMLSPNRIDALMGMMAGLLIDNPDRPELRAALADAGVSQVGAATLQKLAMQCYGGDRNSKDPEEEEEQRKRRIRWALRTMAKAVTADEYYRAKAVYDALEKPFAEQKEEPPTEILYVRTHIGIQRMIDEMSGTNFAQEAIYQMAENKNRRIAAQRETDFKKPINTTIKVAEKRAREQERTKGQQQNYREKEID